MVQRIDLVIGPMFSGKTSELLRILSRYQSLGKNICYINHSLDSRSSDPLSTHNPTIKFDGKMTSFKVPTLSEVKIDDFDVIAIDEAQFFQDLMIVTKWDKHIIIAGLSGDVQKRKFCQIIDLIPYASNIQHVKAFCKICSSEGKAVDAPFTRLKKEQGIVNGQILIGDSDTYFAVCEEHFSS